MNGTPNSPHTVFSQRSTDLVRRGAFTLIELLIVIAIVGIVVAIVLPALSGTRIAAKKASTGSMMSQLTSASGQFLLDNRRPPGYFSPQDMADPENVTRGFSAMQNVMLDLAGGITPAARSIGNGNPADETAAGPQIVTVGPRNDPAKQVNVNVSQIGASTATGGAVTKAYWVPEKKLFVRHALAGQKGITPPGGEPDVDHRTLPDVVDSFGQPLLAWTQDESAPATAEFGGITYTSGGQRAKFYWAPNAVFLKATALGKLATTQAFTANDAAHSLIGDGRGDPEIRRSLAGILGNPAYPDPKSPPPLPPIPAAARGTLVFHSAGADGYYVGSTDRGGKVSAGNSNYAGIAGLVNWSVEYNIPLPAKGEPQPDAMARFDDLLVKGDSSGG